MPSFFEKLKKGMGVEIPVEEGVKEKPKPAQKKTPSHPSRPNPPQVLKTLKKVEIKDEEKLPEVEELKPEGREVKEKEVKVKKEKWFEPEGELAVDVYQTDGEIVIQSTIAGVKPENLDISIENDQVLIKGSREKLAEEEERNYFYQECYWGPFSRQIILPEETDPSRTEAVMKEGVLTIRIPKIERKKRKKIVVKE